MNKKNLVNDFGKPELKSVFGKRKEYATIVDINVIVRILNVLQENGRTKGTHLSGKTNLNYSRCVRYLNLFILLGWVKVLLLDGINYFIITEKGTEVLNNLSCKIM